jgi:hypothetical protein
MYRTADIRALRSRFPATTTTISAQICMHVSILQRLQWLLNLLDDYTVPGHSWCGNLILQAHLAGQPAYRARRTYVAAIHVPIKFQFGSHEAPIRTPTKIYLARHFYNHR